MNHVLAIDRHRHRPLPVFRRGRAGRRRPLGAAGRQVAPHPVARLSPGGKSRLPSLWPAIALTAWVVSSVARAQDPTFSGAWPGYARGMGFLSFDGRYLYHAFNGSTWHGLQLFDLADFGKPVAISSFSDTEAVVGLARSGSHLLMQAYGRGGLQVIDVSDPTRLEIVGQCWCPGTPWAVSDGYLFQSRGVDGLFVVDVRDSANPTPVSLYKTGGAASCVALSGQYALVGELEGNLRVVDVSDPYNPALVGTCATGGGVFDMALRGNHALVPTYPDGLVVIDFSDPAQPVRVANYGAPAASILVSGSLAFLSRDMLHLEVLDVTDPVKPTTLSTYAANGRAMALSGHYLLTQSSGGNYPAGYRGELSEGIEVLDFSNPAKLARVGVVPTSGYAREVAAFGDFALVADSTGGLKVIDVRNPARPARGARVAEVGCGRVVVEGDTAFAFGDLTQTLLHIVDLSRPTSPVRLAAYDAHLPVRDVVATGSYAWVAAGAIQTLDIRERSRPVLLATRDFGVVRRLLGAGDYLFGCGGQFVVLDRTNPTNLVRVGGLSLEMDRMASTGSHVYGLVRGRDVSSLQVVDVADPRNPLPQGQAVLSAPQSRGVAVSGHYVFASTEEGGVEVFDVSDPLNPVRVGGYATQRSPEGLALSGGQLLVANGIWGLTVLDCSSFLGALPRLLPPEREGDGWDFTITGQSGVAHQLLRAQEVNGPWVPVGTITPANGVATLRDTSAPGTRAFYQVIRP